MRRADKFPSEKRTGVIAFDALSKVDEIIIRTRNSEYRFLVLDPARRYGLLSGGRLAGQKREAVLAGMLSSETTDFSSDPSGLKTREHALFYLKASSGLERVVTSEITQMGYILKSESRSVA